MPNFTYIALNGNGNEISDTLAADSQRAAIKKIRDMGCFPTQVRPTSHRTSEQRIEDAYGTVQKQSYIEYLSELFGNKLIAWGTKLKGENG